MNKNDHQCGYSPAPVQNVKKPKPTPAPPSKSKISEREGDMSITIETSVITDEDISAILKLLHIADDPEMTRLVIDINWQEGLVETMVEKAGIQYIKREKTRT